jgi:2-hydroxy-6-oxonona-2,4-dienedioate hydrolase
VRTRLGYARVAGVGPPVVLVHGLAVSSFYFVKLGRRLRSTHRVIAPDLPGYGKSGTPPRPLDVPQLADALTEWLDVLGVERAQLVGNSLGCQIAVDLAVRRPERVERLVLVGPTMDPAAPTIPGQAWRLARDLVRESPLLNLAQARDYLRMGPRRILATARFALDDPLEEKLPQVAAPALVIRGRRDMIVSQEWAERVAALLPRGRLAVVPAAHAAHWGAADDVARLVQEAGEG